MTPPASNHIVFFDTTLRDGEQSPGCTMHAPEKLRLAHQLASLGVDIIEAGFAIASEGDAASIRQISAKSEPQTAPASPPSQEPSAKISKPPPAPSKEPTAAASTPSSPPQTST